MAITATFVNDENAKKQRFFKLHFSQHRLPENKVKTGKKIKFFTEKTPSVTIIKQDNNSQYCYLNKTLPLLLY